MGKIYAFQIYYNDFDFDGIPNVWKQATREVLQNIYGVEI